MTATRSKTAFILLFRGVGGATQLPTAPLREALAEAGFENCITQEVDHWVIKVPAREALAQGRLDKAATSQLSVLTDEEYERGIQRLLADLQRAEEQGQTLSLIVDLRLYGTIGWV